MRKIIPILAIAGLLFSGVALAKVDRVSGGYGPWNVMGTYKWLVLGTYEHDMVITTQNPDGTFSGTGGYPAGHSPYNLPGETTETITGHVVGNQITFTTTYAGWPYSVTVSGTIAPDGTMSGTDPWEWHTTSGVAIHTLMYKNHGQYVRSQTDRKEAAHSRIGMPIKSKGHTK